MPKYLYYILYTVSRFKAYLEPYLYHINYYKATRDGRPTRVLFHSYVILSILNMSMPPFLYKWFKIYVEQLLAIVVLVSGQSIVCAEFES